MGRYVELARRTIETLHARVQLPVASEGSSDQHSPYEIDERNEKSLSATSVRNAPHIVTVPAWAAGVARLPGMPPFRSYPPRAWQQLILDAEAFLDRWGGQAAALGWPTWDLFGCHRRTPWGRIEGMGLVLLLRGDEIAALTATEAVIRTRTGVQQIYRRKPRDPLHPAERGLVWEMDSGR